MHVTMSAVARFGIYVVYVFALALLLGALNDAEEHNSTLPYPH